MNKQYYLREGNNINLFIYIMTRTLQILHSLNTCYLLLSGVSEKFVRMDTLVRYMEQDELKDQENTHGHDACNSNKLG